MKTKKSKNRSGFARMHVVPIIIWMGAVACTVMLFHQRTQKFQIVGIAQENIRQIAAAKDGRLKSVSVELYQKVNFGDKIAIIDTVLEDESTKALRQAQLKTATAEIQHLMAEMVPTQEILLAEAENAKSDRIAVQRRFAVDVENTRLDLLEIKVNLASDRILLGDLNSELKISRQLLEQDVIKPYELEKAKVQYEALSKKIEENEVLLEQANENLTQAKQRQNEFIQRQPFNPSVDSALDIIRKAVKVQEKLIEELLIKPVPMTLTATLDGIVSHIYYGAGDAVLAGEPIITIAESEPAEIVAYASEQQASTIKEKMKVQLIKNNYPAQIATSRVTHLGPNVELMPERLWRNPNVPQWGRPILIKIPNGLKLIPGEMVGIKGL